MKSECEGLFLYCRECIFVCVYIYIAQKNIYGGDEEVI